MKKIFYFIVATAMLAVSCTKLIDQSESFTISLGNEDSFDFKATTDSGILTKTTISSNADENGNYGLEWKFGDKISIYDGSSVAVYETYQSGNAATFKVSSGTLDRSALSYTAYYPSSITPNNMVLPSEQTYLSRSVESFPMIAMSEDRNLAFKNLCGILRLNVTAENSLSVNVKSISVSCERKGLSGEFSVGNDCAAVVSGTDGVVLNCADPVSLYSASQTMFNIVVPKGEYEKLRVNIMDSNNKEVRFESASPVKIMRSGITQVSIKLKQANFDGSLEVITFIDSDVEFTER